MLWANNSDGFFDDPGFNSSSFEPEVHLYQNNRRAIFDSIDRYVTPVWYILGIPGNILACSVWIQRRMRPSSGCYLAALAMDECLFLVLQIFFELQTRWSLNLLHLPGLCQLFPIIFLTSQQLSPLLVLGFTVERYISVCHPFQRDRFCTTKRALISIAGFVAFSLALNSIQGYFWFFSFTSNECELRSEATDAGSGSMWSVYSWITEMLVFGAVPLAILFLNILVLLETKRLADSEKLLVYHQKPAPNSATPPEGHNRFSGPSATTLMLLAVSFYLIITVLPVTIFYVLYFTFKEGDPNLQGESKMADPTWNRHFAYNEIRTVVDEFGMSHYACNFYIYLFTGKTFRRELKRLFVGNAKRHFLSDDRKDFLREKLPIKVSIWSEIDGKGTSVRIDNPNPNPNCNSEKPTTI